MSQPKLTPLPEIEDSADYSFAVCCWFDANRPALESIIKQQENTVEPHNVNNAPTRGDIDALRADLIARINQADRDVRAIIDHERERVDNRLDALEANIKAHESGIDEYGNPLTDTFADRLRHVERKVFQLESSNHPDLIREAAIENQVSATDQSKPKPKCELCHDHRYIDVSSNKANTSMRSLCPCVKVGDVVSCEIANLLPVGSRFDLDGNVWERFDIGWDAEGSSKPVAKWFLHGGYSILRIGPAPATDNAPGWAEHSRSADGKARYQCPECEVISRELDNGIPSANRHSSTCKHYKPLDDAPDKTVEAVKWNPSILSTPECEALPVGSIVHSAWNKYREYAVKTPTHWLTLDPNRTVGLSSECGDGWVVDYVPTQANGDKYFMGHKIIMSDLDLEGKRIDGNRF